ncbi:hypothetical protein JCM10213_002881 [Rhodosporidiobolus nylandii]
MKLSALFGALALITAASAVASPHNDGGQYHDGSVDKYCCDKYGQNGERFPSYNSQDKYDCKSYFEGKGKEYKPDGKTYDNGQYKNSTEQYCCDKYGQHGENYPWRLARRTYDQSKDTYDCRKYFEGKGWHPRAKRTDGGHDKSHGSGYGSKDVDDYCGKKYGQHGEHYPWSSHGKRHNTQSKPYHPEDTYDCGDYFNKKKHGQHQRAAGVKRGNEDGGRMRVRRETKQRMDE